MSPNDKELTREEDYRDYEERDIEEGWPYGDAPGETAGKVGNGPYGGAGANFDSESNKGFTVADVDAAGDQERQPDSLLAATRGRENVDDIEERVMDALSNFEGVSPESIDVRAEGSILTLEGEVDDAITARHLEQRALGVDGVRKIRNNLRIVGVDANIPGDN